MKKSFKGLMAIAFAFVLLLSLTGCGEQKENNGGNNNGGNDSKELYTIKDSDIDVDSNYDISMVPSVIKKGIGTMKKFNVTTPRPADEYKTTIRYGFKVETDDIDTSKKALLDYYTNNGGSAKENGSIETIVTFDWGNIVVSVYTTGSIDCVANVNK